MKRVDFFTYILQALEKTLENEGAASKFMKICEYAFSVNRPKSGLLTPTL